MKKLITFLLAMCLSLSAIADCDYSKIQKVENGYLYSRELHLCVGQMKQDLEIATDQNLKFQKALELKDLALNKADQRADMWQQTAFKLEDRITTISGLRTDNQWLMFGFGMASMFAASYAASQFYKGR